MVFVMKNRSKPRKTARRRARIATITLCAASLVAFGCTGGKSNTGAKPEAAEGAPSSDKASDKAQGATKTDDSNPAATRPAKNTEKPMSGDSSSDSSSGLAQINELLAANPAREKDCGDKHTQLRRDGDKLVADVTLSECDRSYRFEVPVAKLVFDKLETEVTPEHGRGQVYILCKNDESCSAWMIRDNDGAEWRKVRDDPEFVIDLAPDADAVKKLQGLLTAWRGG